MTAITLQGKPIHIVGTLPAVGTEAPYFTLTKTDLSEITLKDFLGKKIVLNIFPSIDTSVCASSARHFNQAANKLQNTVVLCVSADLPFAFKRFCAAEGLDQIQTASVFRHPEFGTQYGVRIADGPLTGLLSRAIVVIDEKGKVIYTQQVPEITTEPDYAPVFNVIT